MLSYLFNQLFFALPMEFYGEYGPTHIKIAVIAILFFLGLFWMLRLESRGKKELKTLLSNHELLEFAKKYPAPDDWINQTGKYVDDCPHCPETCTC